jgi:hypothetical protein
MNISLQFANFSWSIPLYKLSDNILFQPMISGKINWFVHFTIQYLSLFSMGANKLLESFRLGCHDKSEKLLKVALGIINQANFSVKCFLEWYCSTLICCLMIYFVLYNSNPPEIYKTKYYNLCWLHQKR